MTNRLRSLLEQLHLSPSEFADRIGVQRSSVSHVLSGRNKPSIDFLEKILNVFPEIDATWLISGKTRKTGNSNQDRENNVNESKPGPGSGFDFAATGKSPAPAAEASVDHIIIVYKNNTFRILNPTED